MSTTFRVHGSFVLGSRSLFVVRGVVITGTLGAGQVVVRPAGLDAPVTGVELRLRNPSGGADESALTFRYANPAQLARWQALVAVDTDLELAAPG